MQHKHSSTPAARRPNAEPLEHRPACGQARRCAADPVVGVVRQGEEADELLEARIQAASDDMVAAQGRYMAGGGFEAMGDRDRAMALFYSLIKLRSPAQVERMRQLQVRRMAIEPGAGGRALP